MCIYARVFQVVKVDIILLLVKMIVLVFMLIEGEADLSVPVRSGSTSR